MVSTLAHSGKFTLWGVEVFLATAEERAISAAARRLGVSISAVSQQLTNLEAALGVDLLDRSARPMALTPAGRLFRARAQAILNEAELARMELARTGRGAVPRIRLGVIEDFDATVTPGVLLDLVAQLPRSRIRLESGASHRLLDLLDSRGLDMVVATEVAAPPPWMDVHPILRDPFVRVLPKSAGPQIEYIKYTSRHVMGQQIEAHLARHGQPSDARFELDSYAAILAMVAEGRGWTILTPLGVASAQRFLGQVDLEPLDTPPLARTISVMTRQDVLLDMPERVAETLRARVAAAVVDPLLARWTWLRGQLEML
ncbi:putative transcriptional regulator [Dinoroseobacter shibae DFL 12 = DSM 16493]|jgi:DNA-binding transcriptional LysR family regulator|uniref:Putative transcriptional regulator n=1 Tax=Dinoroseobacter shibae (strain DSM 16493 / NCIMB 14021 / DFL 12) TaxID=398580 RepID=A8LR42_DINSH|nr:putative transcriptional regulator [Dinoroseobacter shibae DFL 12 = DSM 16493]